MNPNILFPSLFDDIAGMNQPFASSADLQAKEISFKKLAQGVYAFTAEGDPNTGVIIGDNSVLVFDAQATPKLASKVLTAIQQLTDLPVRYVVLSHYHAVRVLGASAYQGAEIIASNTTHGLIKERGQQDWESEYRRFPRLFDGAEDIPGLTQPTVIFDQSLSIDIGNRLVTILHPGAGHTAGDTVIWLEQEKILFAGDLVENGAAPYCGDAYFEEWVKTLSELALLNPDIVLPGRGNALTNSRDAQQAIAATRSYISKLFHYVQEAINEQADLKETFQHVRKKMDATYQDWVIYEHCLPFSVSRAYDEASGQVRPSAWNAERDQKLWQFLQA